MTHPVIATVLAAAAPIPSLGVDYECAKLISRDRTDEVNSLGFNIVEGTSANAVVVVAPDPDTPPAENWIRENASKGSCHALIVVDVLHNPNTGNSRKNFTIYGGPTTTGKDVRKLLLDNTDPAVWQQTRTLVFSISFYGWYLATFHENYIENKKIEGREWIAPSDTKFKIRRATVAAI
jgi:hypothetical protein